MEEDSDALVAVEPLRKNACRRCTISEDISTVRAQVQLNSHPHHITTTQLNSSDAAERTAVHFTSACFTACNTTNNLFTPHTQNPKPQLHLCGLQQQHHKHICSTGCSEILGVEPQDQQ